MTKTYYILSHKQNGRWWFCERTSNLNDLIKRTKLFIKANNEPSENYAIKEVKREQNITTSRTIKII